MGRKLSVDTQTFAILRNEDYVYVDKTGYIEELLERGRIFFLSRPRRFGKSLFVSTLEAYFSGKKDLFKGLDIEKYEAAKGEKGWQRYPVLSFHLSGGDFNAEGGLEAILSNVIDNSIRAYDLKDDYEVSGESLPVRFSNLIDRLYHKYKRQVVVLVDEYDNPLLRAEDEERESRNREIYKSFFGVLKDVDEYLKFVFFTGVTKFSKVSIFSDLNQLKDISMLDQFAGICGFTQTEITENLRPQISAMAESQGITENDCIDKLRKMYDGYHFSRKSEGIYNPYSLLNALYDRSFDNYWFESATPTFLIKHLQNSSIRPEQFEKGIEADESEMKDYRTDNPNPVPLFYQSGYLTIKSHDAEFGTYQLGFPNREVKYGFLRSLVPYVYGERDAEISFSAKNMVLAIRHGDVESLREQIYALFASVPYMTTNATRYEEVWRNQIYLVFAILGEFVVCEQHTSTGRSDCVIETSKYIYVFEFKVDKSADEAISQIEANDYAGRYRSDSRQIFYIGVNFSSTKRNIDDWKVITK